MNHLRRLCAELIALCALIISGCAELNSIDRSEGLPASGPHVIAIDAKQRMILANPAKASSNPAVQAALRFCAEPPPDVFTALATSLGADASVSQPDVALKLAMSVAENAATIEHTQTVNILREMMYRNCERYLSGAIGEDEFIVQAARDQQLIVQVLAVEQITGVAKAQSTALQTVAKLASTGVSESSIEALTSAKKDYENRRTASEKGAAAAAAVTPVGACGASPIDTANLPDGVTAEQAAAKNAQCKEAAALADLANEAKAFLATVSDAVAKQGSACSEAQGKLLSLANNTGAVNEQISQKVVDIVNHYSPADEMLLACAISLRKSDAKPSSGDTPATANKATDKSPDSLTLRRECLKLLTSMAQLKAAEAQLRTAEAEERAAKAEVRAQAIQSSSLDISPAAARQVVAKLDEEASSVWNHIKHKEIAQRLSRLEALALHAGIPAAQVQPLSVPETFTGFKKAFQLFGSRRSALASAARQ